jgi:hypothetical protein
MTFLLMMTGCGLSEDEACELSQRWLRGHTLLLSDGREVDDAEVAACSGLHTRSDVGEADITVDVEWTVEGDSFSTTFDRRVTCYLVDYDQGWAVEACLDT